MDIMKVRLAGQGALKSAGGRWDLLQNHKKNETKNDVVAPTIIS